MSTKKRNRNSASPQIDIMFYVRQFTTLVLCCRGGRGQDVHDLFYPVPMDPDVVPVQDESDNNVLAGPVQTWYETNDKRRIHKRD